MTATDAVTQEAYARLREFVEARGSCTFHTPKNLTMAFTGEVTGLAELLQWLKDE